MEVSFINPGRGPSCQSSDGYYLFIKDGVAESYLPFFGVSHGMAGFGTEPGGIEFDKCPVIIDDSQSKPEKGKYIWRFVAKTGSENVTVILTFWTNGSVQFSCNPQFRSVMNYSGSLVPFPVVKKKK